MGSNQAYSQANGGDLILKYDENSSIDAGNEVKTG
jgi:hypothetical protein